jgi:hydroxymethylbilane synthase
LDGGCQVPIAGLAQINGAEIYLVGLTGSLDGKTIIRDSVKGNRGDAVGLGKRLGEKLLEKGAGELLAQARKNLENAEQAVIL